MTPYRQIRAAFDDSTVTVYQAYSAAIAGPAVAAQKLTASPNFKAGRMTWIKPSWAWVLYRSGYSYKDPRQERILALKMRREDFVNLLRRGVLSHAPGGQPVAPERGKTTDVRIQWDPERTVRLGKLEHRSIQIGVPAALSVQWAEEWVVQIDDVTDKARELKRLLDEDQGITDEELTRLGLIPEERVFQIPEDVQQRLGIVAPEEHDTGGRELGAEEKVSRDSGTDD